VTTAVCTDVIHAAGGVVWRAGERGEPEVILVHRPKYDDWSIPKGKREDGETDEECALREVEEETGLRCELGPELAGTAYLDRKGRPKEVRYWVMTPLDGAFEPGDEVDAVVWLGVEAACAQLTHPHEGRVLESFVQGV